MKELGLKYRRLSERAIFSLDYELRTKKIEKFLRGAGLDLSDYKVIISQEFADKVRLYRFGSLYAKTENGNGTLMVL